MTECQLRSLVKAFAPAIRELIDRRIEERLRDLSVQRDAPTTPHVRHQGEWRADRVYEPGDGVLHRGLAYRAMCTSHACEPDDDSGPWERL